MKSTIIACIFLLNMSMLHAQYELVWSDEFNNGYLDTARWNIESQVGIWNTGANKELQHYKKENIGFGTDTAGNKCLIISAKKETYQNYSFTSGKIDTKAKFSVKYGKIEARIKMPDIANGLWPAFWLLGFTPETWPKNGEIDVVELGFKDGISNNTQNKLISGALHWDNQNSPASPYASYGKKTVLNTSLNDDFHVYTLEWTPSYIKMFVDGAEYYAMNITGSDAEEFRNNFYFIILNLAVGGMFPEITDPVKITAPMPANMYVDYVRVYQKAGEGEINNKPHAMYGNFGVYDETGSYNFQLDPGYDLKIQTNGLILTSQTAFEGIHCAAFTSNNNQDYELSFMAPYSRNMINYSDGSIYFYIKTNIQNDIIVSLGNAELVINSSSAYNFVRNDTWTKVNIPFSEFGASINFDSIVQFLSIKGVGADGAFIAIDKVFWSPLKAANEGYLGIYTENPDISDKIAIDNKTVHLYIWEGTLAAYNDTKIYEGKADLAFKGVSGKTWFGYGITADNAMDFTAYKDGAMHLSLKTTAQNEFWIGIAGANKTEAKLTFPENSGLYGFQRDGQWYNLVIPMADFSAKGVDLSACGNIFMLGGSGIPANIVVDDIYLSRNREAIANPAVNEITSVKKENSSEIRVYPNPAVESISVSGMNGSSLVAILDLSGKTLVTENGFLNHVLLDVRQLKEGVYFIKVVTSGQSYVMKFYKK